MRVPREHICPVDLFFWKEIHNMCPLSKVLSFFVFLQAQLSQMVYIQVQRYTMFYLVFSRACFGQPTHDALASRQRPNIICIYVEDYLCYVAHATDNIVFFFKTKVIEPTKICVCHPNVMHEMHAVNERREALLRKWSDQQQWWLYISALLYMLN